MAGIHELGDEANEDLCVKLYCGCMVGDVRSARTLRNWYYGEWTHLSQKQARALKKKHAKCKEKTR